MNDNALQIEILQQCIAKSQKNKALMVTFQVRLCKFLISIHRASEAKDVALKLYETNKNNESYKAMLLMAAVHCKDTDLAKRMDSNIKMSKECDENKLNECLRNVPNVSGDEKFGFEINEENEALRKTKLNQRKRAKIATKLRAKYKENPKLFKEPIDWTSKKNEKKEEKIEKKVQKKKKAYTGAQGGSGESKQFDIVNAKNNKKNVKKAIPQHIKKRKR